MAAFIGRLAAAAIFLHCSAPAAKCGAVDGVEDDAVEVLFDLPEAKGHNLLTSVRPRPEVDDSPHEPDEVEEDGVEDEDDAVEVLLELPEAKGAQFVNSRSAAPRGG